MYLLVLFSSSMYSFACSGVRPPIVSAMVCSSRSTSAAIRSLSPQTKNSAPSSSQAQMSRACSLHPVLNVDLVRLIARERRVEPEQAVAHVAVQLGFVEEVGRASLLAEEQPVLSRRAGDAALLDERAERRESGAGPDHDQRPRRIGGHREVLLLILQIHRRRAGDRPAIGEPGRRHALAHAAANRVADRHHEKVDFARVRIQARRDRIQAGQALAKRLQRARSASAGSTGTRRADRGRRGLRSSRSGSA